MSELKPIKVTELPEFDYSEDMYMLVSKKVGDGYVSGKMKISAVGCKCGVEPVPIPPIPDYKPDDFGHLPKNERTIFHSMTVRGYGEGYNLRSGLSELHYDQFIPAWHDREGNQGYYADTNMPPYIGAVGTYPVIDIDEISVFRQPVRIHTGQNTHGSLCNGLDVRLSDVEGLLRLRDYQGEFPLRAWDAYIGGFYAWGHAEIRGIFFPRYFDIYADAGKTERLNGYDVITTAQWLQMLGQMPRFGSSFMENVKDFFCINDSEPVLDPVSFEPYFPLNTGYPMASRMNISRMGLYPAGKVPNSGSHNTRPLNVDGFGNMVCLATKRNAGDDQVYLTYLSDGVAGVPDGLTIASDRAFAHGGNLRYARTKTANELGYKLVINEADDRVYMLPADGVTENDMPTGLERGVALRYANRANRVITKPYSVIKSEAAEIAKNFVVNENV